MTHALGVHVALLVALTMSGCAGDRPAARAESSPKTPTTEEAPVTPPMQTTTATEMTTGAPLTPVNELLTWLESHAKRGDVHRLMRLPVVVRIRPDKLGTAGAHIGTTPGDAPQGAIELNLTDTALSVGLWERIREGCDLDDGSCVLWLEGYWRELLPMPGLPGLDVGPKPYPFDVRGVGDGVDASATHVFIAP